MLDMYKKTAAAVITAAVMLTLTACSTQGGEMTDNNNSGGQVAGASQQVVYGYILEANRQTRTVLVDTFDLIPGSGGAGGMADSAAAGGSQGMGMIPTADGRYINEAGGRFLYPLSTDVYLELSNADYSTSAFYNSRLGKTDSGVFSTDQENSGLAGIGENDGGGLGDLLGGGAENGGDANDAVDRMDRNRNTVLQDGMEGIDDITNNTEIYNAGHDLLTDDDAEKATRDKNGGANMNGQKQNSSADGSYKGNDVAKLQQRIGEFRYIPFRLMLEDDKVVRIVEMSELYD